MKRQSKRPVIWLLLLMLLLSACRTQPDTDPDSSGNPMAAQGGTVTVYAREQYRYGLQQVFSHLSLSADNLRIFWTGDVNTADVVITDHLPAAQLSEFRTIDTALLELEGVSELVIRDDRGTVALPLFLRMDGFWYDAQIYANQELTVPQSLDSWQKCPLRQTYPAVCDEADMDALFWGVVAPYYMDEGGDLQALATGSFDPDILLKALERTANLTRSGLLTLSTQAQQSFVSQKAGIWLAGVDQLAACYHSMSNLSTWRTSASLPFQAQKRSCCVVRADVLAVRKTADRELTDWFLKLFYTAKTISDLSDYVRMPAACRMNYAPAVVPQLPQVCYTLLASPSVDVHYTCSRWDQSRQEQVEQILLDLMHQELTPQEATNLICA